MALWDIAARALELAARNGCDVASGALVLERTGLADADPPLASTPLGDNVAW